MSSRNCACGGNGWQCTCSQSEAFPLVVGTGGAFNADSGMDSMNASFMTTIQGNSFDDPRMDDDIFGSSLAYGRSAPVSSPMRDRSFSRGQMQPMASSMGRRLSTQRSISSQGYPAEGDRAPVPARFAQTNSDELMFSTNHGTANPIYREPQQGPSSYTGSSYSRGQFSHRGSDASNWAPGTPLTDIDLGAISLSSSPSYRETFSPHETQFPGAGYEHNDYTSTGMGPPMASAMTRSQSRVSGQKEKTHWCDIQPCSHGKAFGTRNDLDRHKLAVHKVVPPGVSIKVFVCQGATCQQQGKTKVWPRKDNFKNHCKVAHQEVDLDTLIARSERLASTLKPNELEGLQAEEPTAAPMRDTHLVQELDPTLADGTSCKPIIKLHCVTTNTQHQSNHLPPPSPDHLSPNGPRRFSFNRACERSQSVSSVATVHQRSPSQPNPPHMERNLSDPTNNSSSSDPIGQNLTNEDIMKALRDRGVPQSAIDALLGSNKQGTKRRSDGSPVTEPQGQRCEKCHKVFKRPCDLKKHMTRHSKPWGCTNRDCYKIFGSKNDWKRHENLRHFPPETWICCVKDGSKRCIETFTNKTRADAHYRSHYPEASASEVQEKIRLGRIGRNWEGAFWCGFCQRVMKLKKKNLDAWDERFDHIDSHLWGRFRLSPEQREAHPDLITDGVEQRQFSIDDWVPPHTLSTKAQLKEQKKSSDAGPASGDQPQSPDADEDGDYEDDDEDQSRDDADSDDLPIEPLSASDDAAPSSVERAAKKLRIEYTWMCGACNSGPMRLTYEDSCSFCGHHRDQHDQTLADDDE